MKPLYDFLSPEDRRWLLRCRLVAALMLVGLIAAIALDTAQGEGGTAERWYASPPSSIACCR
jgi:hypothetical protein